MGDDREVQDGGDIHIYICLVHVDIWQKSTQYCKAIILQLKTNKFLKKEFSEEWHQSTETF